VGEEKGGGGAPEKQVKKEERRGEKPAVLSVATKDPRDGRKGQRR